MRLKYAGRRSESDIGERLEGTVRKSARWSRYSGYFSTLGNEIGNTGSRKTCLMIPNRSIIS